MYTQKDGLFCTCAYKTGAASMNEIIIVGQDEGAPLLHLQAILTTGDSLAAVHLGGLEVLRTQPGLINHLGGRQRGEGRGEREEDRWRGSRGDIDESGRVSLDNTHTYMQTLTCMCIINGLYSLMIFPGLSRYTGDPNEHCY